MGQDGRALMSDEQLYQLILFGLSGVGPDRSQPQVAALGTNLLKQLDGGGTFPGAPTDTATAQLAAACVLAWYTDSLNQPVTDISAVAAGKQDEALDMRVSELKRLGAYSLGAVVAPTHAVATHFLKWLEDPWVKGATFAKVADALMRVGEEYRMRSPTTGPFNLGSLFAGGDLFDTKVVNLPAFQETINADQPTTQMPNRFSEFFHPLAGDMHFPLSVEEVDLAPWIEIGWSLTKAAEMAESDFVKYGDPTVATIQLATLSPELRGEGGIAGLSSAAGYPILSSVDDTINSPTSMWSLRSLDLDTFHMLQSRQSIADAMAVRPYMPVRITGTASSPFPQLFPTLQPLFEDFDDVAPVLPITGVSLGQLWNTTADRINEQLAALRAQPDDINWRGIAQSLRFVGILTMRGSVVEPYNKHWFHARAFDSGCLSAPIELLGGDKAVKLTPFKYIPLSARIDLIHQNLIGVSIAKADAALPLVAWIAPSEDGKAKANPSKVAIRGWSITDNSLIDITLIRTVNPVRHDYYLTGPETGFPVSGRPYNAALAGGEPISAVPVPTMTLPDGALVLLP